MPELGRLKKVDLREVWSNEAYDFTPWLAKEESIVLLGDSIGLELEVESTEENVGPFRADILCKNTADSSWVLVENQIDKTDHCHLGQLLTYAAGLDAVTIIWVARLFNEEHRAALDWLNEKTDEDVNFFGLEIELWRIGDSPVAPKFNIISKPNDWSRTIKNTAAKAELTDTKRLQLEYWTKFLEHMENKNPNFRLQKAAPQNWLCFSIGRSYFQIVARVSTRGQQIGAYLNIWGPDRLKYFDTLEKEYSQEAEKEIGIELDWRRMPDKKESHVDLYHDCAPSDENDWPQQFEWLANAVTKLHAYFSPIVTELDISDFADEEEDI